MVMRQCDDHCETVGRSGETVGRSGETVGRSGETVGRSGETVGRSGETVGRSTSLWEGRQVCQGSGDVVRRLGRCQGAGTSSGKWRRHIVNVATIQSM